jgi:hypothetical protein
MEISLWQAGLLLLIALIIGLFLRSLKFGKRFHIRQEMRRNHMLETKRTLVNEEVARKALSIAIMKSEAKK